MKTVTNEQLEPTIIVYEGKAYIVQEGSTFCEECPVRDGLLNLRCSSVLQKMLEEKLPKEDQNVVPLNCLYIEVTPLA